MQVAVEAAWVPGQAGIVDEPAVVDPLGQQTVQEIVGEGRCIAPGRTSRKQQSGQCQGPCACHGVSPFPGRRPRRNTAVKDRSGARRGRHPPSMTADGAIRLRGLREPPLTGVDLTIPLGRIVCLSGAMGAGVEALARRVLLDESRRRYLLSMSPFERAILGGVSPAAAVDDIDGLPPARPLPGPAGEGTVGSRLQLLGDLSRLARGLSRIACPACGRPCAALDEEGVAELLAERFGGQTVWFVAPVALEDPAVLPRVLEELARAGFRRLRVGSELRRLDRLDAEALPAGVLEVVVDRLAPGAGRTRARVGEAVRTSRAIASGAGLLVGEEDGLEVWTGPRLTCAACGSGQEEPDWERAAAGGHDGRALHRAGRPALGRLGGEGAAKGPGRAGRGGGAEVPRSRRAPAEGRFGGRRSRTGGPAPRAARGRPVPRRAVAAERGRGTRRRPERSPAGRAVRPFRARSVDEGEGGSRTAAPGGGRQPGGGRRRRPLRGLVGGRGDPRRPQRVGAAAPRPKGEPGPPPRSCRVWSWRRPRPTAIRGRSREVRSCGSPWAGWCCCPVPPARGRRPSSG